jgi:hypothetical protein
MSGLLLNGLAGVAEIVARGEPLPAFDLHCPLLSLPLAFGTHRDTVFARRSAISDQLEGTSPAGASSKDRAHLVRWPDAAASIDETQGVIAAA